MLHYFNLREMVTMSLTIKERRTVRKVANHCVLAASSINSARRRFPLALSTTDVNNESGILMFSDLQTLWIASLILKSLIAKNFTKKNQLNLTKN